MTNNMLYKRFVAINDAISVYIPTVGEVLDGEDKYYSLVSLFVSTPTDLMVQLDDVGIDFSQIDEYELFLLLFQSSKEQDLSLIFGDLDIKNFCPIMNEQTKSIVLENPYTGARIDKLIHAKIANTLRKINNFEKNTKRPGNEDAKKYMIERARKKLQRSRSKSVDSNLESLIVAVVNTEQFHYDFDSVRNLTLYQFNESVRQIIKKVDYDNKMHGVYAGTISAKDLSQDDLNWLVHK